MRNLNFYLTLLLFASTLASCSSSNFIQSVPQTKPIVIDGDASDWQLPLAYYDKETKLSFTVSNDSSKLYFCFQAFDQELQTKIVRGGFQIFLDTNGGTGKDVSMLYPVSSTLQRPESSYGGGYGSSSDNFDPIAALRRSFFRSQANEILLTGFFPPASGLVPLRNAFGIEVRINWDTINNVLNYEASIPFSTFYKHLLVPADSSRVIGLTFTVNGVTRPSGANRQASSDGSSGGGAGYPGSSGGVYPGGGASGGGFGGGGRGGGGRHGGGRGASSGSSMLAESQTLSVKLRLAKPS